MSIIDLRYNQIEHISFDIFYDHKKTGCVTSYWKQRELNRCAFLGLSPLCVLDISEKITAVSEDTFAELLALEKWNMQ